MGRRYKNTQEWIDALPEKQKETYSHEKVVYTGADNKIEVTCKEHGSFWQAAWYHKNGGGCPTCFGKRRGATQRSNKEEFIEKTESVAEIAGKYDYSEVVYVNGITPVTIICPKHGPFKMSPGNHLFGKGCLGCFNERRGLNNLKSLSQFKEDAISQHGGLYNYDSVVYKTCKEKVKIGCKIHGMYLSTPDSHLTGSGCPKCAKSGYNPGKAGYLYILSAGDMLKVGITNKGVGFRRKSVSKSSGEDFSVVTSMFFEDGQVPANIETQALRWLRANFTQVTRKFDGFTECFTGCSIKALTDFIVPLASSDVNNHATA